MSNPPISSVLAAITIFAVGLGVVVGAKVGLEWGIAAGILEAWFGAKLISN